MNLSLFNTCTAFRESGYCHVEGLLDSRSCELATQYAKFSMARGFSPEGGDEQVPGAHASYADPLMETLLLTCYPLVEQVTGLRLVPTYSYYRVYGAGDALARHFDRPSCEISVSLCLGCSFKDIHGDDSWPIFIGGKKGKRGDPGVAICCRPGDAVVYCGCELEHWREPMRSDPGSYQIQVFLHYVDASGPFADLCRFDARPALGLPRTARDRRRLEKAMELTSKSRLGTLNELEYIHEQNSKVNCFAKADPGVM